jgi:deazaflavin-dependent oxidoreductase (nitroreductase family)
MDPMRAADRLWPVLNRLMKGHALVYRATGGLVGHRFLGSPPMLLLDHVGAQSGRKRTTPLVYVRDGEDVVVIASKGGHPRNPAWFHNLRANPDTTIQVGSRRRPVHARVATPEERGRLWPKAVEAYAGYSGYQRRTRRKIPLVILEPRVPQSRAAGPDG